MQAPLRKTVSLITLIIFLMGVITYHFSSARFAHELDHDIHTLEMTGEHVHTALLDHDEPSSKKQLSDTDHRMLHSVMHLEPFLTNFIFDGYGDLSVQIVPLFSYVLLLPLAEIEPLFRPPRTINLV